MNWKKIDKNNLPSPYEVLFLESESGEWGMGEAYTEEDQVSVYWEGDKLLSNATHYIDPSELPMPGKVRLDWWDQGNFSEAIFGGKKFLLEQADTVVGGYVFESPEQEEGRVIISQTTLPEAKAACERYAAGLIESDKS